MAANEKYLTNYEAYQPCYVEVGCNMRSDYEASFNFGDSSHPIKVYTWIGNGWDSGVTITSANANYFWYRLPYVKFVAFRDNTHYDIQMLWPTNIFLFEDFYAEITHYEFQSRPYKLDGDLLWITFDYYGDYKINAHFSNNK